LFSGSGINAFRMASSNSSPAEKSCACAYIAFLAGIFSWYEDSTGDARSDVSCLSTTSVQFPRRQHVEESGPCVRVKSTGKLKLQVVWLKTLSVFVVDEKNRIR
jgi:hypothetical protein